MQNQVVSRDEWLKARVALLEKEKAFSQAREALSQEQRALPWVRIEKNYVFDTRSGKKTLSDLFDGRSQLFVKHFMMEPGQQQQCVGCSFTVDHVAGILPHLENHDVSYVAVARAPISIYWISWWQLLLIAVQHWLPWSFIVTETVFG